ncbi:DUF6153 family protein [Nocardia huaxiensis]|uniref:Uncharacterized protein n=1 Tax=Nocardia huaxiensis TaxID=2755382 RepID=A0A7D6VDQ5_9NOCA|nr:DUF6153 family protein [Nocardia huaxiensis]QLY32653.1 hypothetical protein H0264_10690 [Nocardia huaxiensis]UFS93615.1 DUF6153 family protein [Nocardia huaxiensis]
MTEQSAPETRYIRAFGLFALLAGIVAMHIAVFGMSHGESSHHEHQAMASVMTVADHEAMTGTGHEAMAATSPGHQAAPACGDCGAHAAVHACVFVLAALLLGVGLILLGWAGLRRDPPATVQARRLRRSRARPPPWTHLTLAELAILRI